MSAAIAHELNQPLGSILNDVEAVELLLNSPQPDLEQLRQLASDIRRSDQRASSIIRHLRTLMTKQPEQFEPVDLGRTAADAVELGRITANTSGVVIHLTIPPNTYTVLGAPIQLQQVLLNLLMNGIDAVKNYPIGRRDVVISASETKARFVEVSVSDSGPGIPPDKLEHIFKPFFTTKENGMGMGLSLCQTIVEIHEGSIWAANGYTGGAIFRFTLPLQKTLEVAS